jgi:hypothetical protein
LFITFPEATLDETVEEVTVYVMVPALGTATTFVPLNSAFVVFVATTDETGVPSGMSPRVPLRARVYVKEELVGPDVDIATAVALMLSFVLLLISPNVVVPEITGTVVSATLALVFA